MALTRQSGVGVRWSSSSVCDCPADFLRTDRPGRFHLPHHVDLMKMSATQSPARYTSAALSLLVASPRAGLHVGESRCAVAGEDRGLRSTRGPLPSARLRIRCRPLVSPDRSAAGQTVSTRVLRSRRKVIRHAILEYG